MADIKINEKNCTGVSEVQIPLADDSGNVRFVIPQDTSWFEQVFRLVGEYDIATATNDDGSVSSYVLKGCFADFVEKYKSLGINAQSGTFASCMVVPSTFDSSQGDTIMILRDFGKINTDSSAASYPGDAVWFKNSYYGFVKSLTASFNHANLTQGFDATADIELCKGNQEYVISATKARLYVLAFPLA